jgi:hypothetical protein
MKALIRASRAITETLIGKPALTAPLRSAAIGLSESLYVTRIRERILVVLPEGQLDEETARARFIIGEASTRLSESVKLALFFSSALYDPANPDVPSISAPRARRDCHSTAFIRKDSNGFLLTIIDANGSVETESTIAIARDRKEEAATFAEKLEKELPLLAPAVLASELEREIVIKEKLDTLLMNERFLSQRLFVNLHQSIFKPAVAGKYHPLLGLFSGECDAYWYYADLFGLGAGYAFSLSYPGTIDSKLSSHPPIAQHELRITPLSFRTPGPVGVLVNLVASIAMQNAYRIVYYAAADKFEFVEEKLLVMLKASLATGLLFNINDDISVFVDLVTLSAVYPLDIGSVTYDGTNISGGVGGIGIIFRF